MSGSRFTSRMLVLNFASPWTYILQIRLVESEGFPYSDKKNTTFNLPMCHILNIMLPYSDEEYYNESRDANSDKHAFV